jgi:hypothetical protein
MSSRATLFCRDSPRPPPDDFESLCNEAERTALFLGLDAHTYLERARSLVRDSILRSCSIAQTTNLIWLQSRGACEYYAPTSGDEVFSFVPHIPQSIMQHNLPRVGQSLGFLLLEIYANIKEFASLVCAFFADDISELLVFAYSTFPALFGFFTLEHYCHQAATFISHVLTIPCSQPIGRFLITSFLFSAYQFNSHFWETFLGRIQNTDQQVSACIVVLKSSLQSSLPYLTLHHTAVLSGLAACDMESFRYVLFHEILVSQLQIRAPHLTDFLKFLEYCCTGYHPIIFDLLEIITHQREFFRSVPTAPGSRVLPRLAFTFTDRDILFVRSIFGTRLSKVPGGQTLEKWTPEGGTSTYRPYYCEIATRIPSQVPECFQVSISREHNRIYSRLQKESADSGRPILSFLRHTRFYKIQRTCSILTTAEFDCVAMHQIISRGQATLQAMDQVMELLQANGEIAVYGRSIDKAQLLVLTHFASGHLLHRKLAEASRGGVFTWERFVAECIVRAVTFPTWAAILNISNLNGNDQLTRLIGLYRDYMQAIVQPRVMIWAGVHANVAVSLTSLVSKMRLAFQLPYGSRLSTFLEIAEIVHGFDMDLKKSEAVAWQNLYEFLMCQLDQRKTIESFVVWNASVFRSETIHDFPGGIQQGMLEAIMSAFVTMIVDGKELQDAFRTYRPRMT